MDSPDRLDFFFGNLRSVMNDAGYSRRKLAAELGVSEVEFNDLFDRRLDPSLEIVYRIADILKMDVADLLRPGPTIAISSGENQNYWVERTAEEYFTNALARSREKSAHEPPTFDAVLSWWYSNEGRLTGMDSFERYIELFERPDEQEMKPRPSKIGAESLSSRELGRNNPELLKSIFESSGAEIARSIAEAHLEVADGQPKLTIHTILVNMSSGSTIQLSYSRLLLPVTDGNGQKFVMNYSKPIRRSEISREQVEHLQSRHGSKPIIARMV